MKSFVNKIQVTFEGGFLYGQNVNKYIESQQPGLFFNHVFVRKGHVSLYLRENCEVRKHFLSENTRNKKIPAQNGLKFKNIVTNL